jgi:response regulator RpfG family c-di-GMP phosphodiesterase
MVTAIDPDFDILEMPFDDYLCKPIDREDIRAVVDQQRQILAYETLGEYFQVKSKREVLVAETNAEQRSDHEEFAALSRRTARLERRARRLLEDETPLEHFEQVVREGL